MVTQIPQITAELTKRKHSLFPPLILITMFYACMPLFSQIESDETMFEDQTEADASELLEYLQSLQRHPFDLNQVTLQNLQLLPFLSPLQAKQIIAERTNQGPFKSWIDFQVRLNIEETLCILIRQYLRINEKEEKKPGSMELRWRLQTQFPKSRGYISDNYRGSPVKAYGRMDFTFDKNTRGGLLIEKDAGESQWYDHFVGFIEKDHLFFLSKLVIGNYRIEVGQGLVFWGPYGYSKGIDTATSVKKRATGIRGYIHADENRYFTGMAIETINRSFSFVGFISNARLDASFNEDDTVSSLLSSGFHRTDSEIEKKGRLNERLWGLRVFKSGSWGVIGFTWYQNNYTNEIKKGDLSRYRFDFRGDKNHVIGLDYDIFLGQTNLSGEIARSHSQGWALITNSLIKIEKSSLILSYRRFEPDYQNLHSNGFGISPARNEEGFYLGFSGRPNTSTRLRFYYDLFRKPWRTYYTPVPTRGNDLLVQIDKRWSSKLSMAFRVRYRQGELMKSGKTPSGIEINSLQDRIHRLLRVELQYQPSEELRFRNRIETVQVNYPETGRSFSTSFTNEKGFLLYYDVHYHPAPDLSIDVRWTLFNTDSYDSRIYAYENDLPGIPTSQLFYLKGIRWYLCIQWKILEDLIFSVKYSTTIHKGIDHWGSGYDQVDGNVEKKLAVQADFKL
ncbi:helix-hairpin-helix domain-containing protein [bacterium]|nr:helix-hairpin-helix domain-containing protein [bacterium]